ncbi:MAG: hypothetical protein IJX46_03775 [Clostridia bacterium]|nr:hypothetical protein [Clostridia bacterium]
MKEYLFSVLGASLATVAVIHLLPDGAKSTKQLKLLVSLALLCTVAAPLSGLTVDGVSDFFSSITESGRVDTDAEEKYYSALTELSSAELESLLRTRISSELSLNAHDLTVTVEAEERDGVFYPTRVAVGLSGAAIFADPYEIEELVESLVGCDCDTYY